MIFSTSLVESHYLKLSQGPRRDSGSARAKNILGALENDTKANFQEIII